MLNEFWQGGFFFFFSPSERKGNVNDKYTENPPCGAGIQGFWPTSELSFRF